MAGHEPGYGKEPHGDARSQARGHAIGQFQVDAGKAVYHEEGERQHSDGHHERKDQALPGFLCRTLRASLGP